MAKAEITLKMRSATKHSKTSTQLFMASLHIIVGFRNLCLHGFSYFVSMLSDAFLGPEYACRVDTEMKHLHCVLWFSVPIYLQPSFQQKLGISSEKLLKVRLLSEFVKNRISRNRYFNVLSTETMCDRTIHITVAIVFAAEWCHYHFPNESKKKMFKI